MSQFQIDLNNAKEGEHIVLEVLSSLCEDYRFEDCSSDQACFHKGDIKAIDKETGDITFIEVKSDSRVSDTKNILCEEENYFKECGYYVKGNMYSDYEIYCVLSKEERKIYMIDFAVLRANYRKGDFKAINHPTQISYSYLLPLGTLKKYGGLIATIDY